MAVRAVGVSGLGHELWRDVRDAFRNQRGSAIADLWIKSARPLAFARGVFTLGVPNEVVREFLEHRYREDLEAIFLRLTGSGVKMILRVDPTLALLEAERADREVEREEAAEFIACAENRLAHAAVQRLIANPATGNPVFLYGPPGVGKTALIRHHMHNLRTRGEARSPTSITAEAFSQGVVRSIQNRELPAFRGRMLAADAFILEEAHRLRGKARTQREMLSVMRYHIERGRPVIITSRHPPNAIFLLDEALRSYFLSGILLRIADYGAPSRAAILTGIASRFARPVPAQTIERIAQRIPGSFDRQCRFLEKVAAFAGLSGREATPEFLAEKFPEIAGSGDREVDLDQLIERIAREFGTTRDDVASNRKTRTAVLARHVVVFIATEVFNLSARRVVRHLGGLSPSTTAYARKKIERRRRDDVMFDTLIRRLMDEIKAGQQMLF